jgi:hypothetical protein
MRRSGSLHLLRPSTPLLPLLCSCNTLRLCPFGPIRGLRPPTRGLLQPHAEGIPRQSVLPPRFALPQSLTIMRAAGSATFSRSGLAPLGDIAMWFPGVSQAHWVSLGFSSTLLSLSLRSRPQSQGFQPAARPSHLEVDRAWFLRSKVSRRGLHGTAVFLRPVAFHLPSINQLKASLLSPACLASIELRNAYWHVLIDPMFCTYLAFQWHDRFFLFRGTGLSSL